MKQRVLFALATLSFIALPQANAQEGAELQSAEKDRKEVALTIYNEDLALVREVRSVSLGEGLFSLAFQDVASTIDATSVHLVSLTHSGKLSVLEQNYEFDLISPRKLMEKFVGKKVKIVEKFELGKQKRIYDALLLSTNDGLVYKINDEIHLNPEGDVVLSEIPDNLRAKPTLVWLLKNTGAKKQDIEVSYLASGLSWKCDYVVVIDKDDKKIDLTGWVTINNYAGTSFDNASLKLIAGDVNRVYDERRHTIGVGYGSLGMTRERAAPPQFKQDSFFEYHIYKLTRPATVKDKQMKQITLLNADGVSVEKKFIIPDTGSYFWSRYEGTIKQKVGVFVEFVNTEKNRMGMPLPKGKIRVYKADKDGAQQFVGEDRIDHTPKNERVKVKLGEAFDIVSERKQTSFRHISKNVYESEYEVLIRNQKKEKVTVEVHARLEGDWEISKNSHPFVKRDAFNVVFNVEALPEKEASLTYKVRTIQR